MFRLFIFDKFIDGIKQLFGRGQNSDQKRQRNRRIFERFNVDHKHLTMLNEQDIFLLREISAFGFSTFTSDRGLDRLSIGDLFAARLRYLGEIYDLEARVSWKSKEVIGFEHTNTSAETKAFLQRLLKPIEIAASLSEVDSEFMKAKDDTHKWYHGESETDLNIWFDEVGKVENWQLIMDEAYVSWSRLHGISSGVIKTSANAASFTNSADSRDQIADREIDPKKKRMAYDIIMASHLDESESLIQTILG